MNKELIRQELIKELARRDFWSFCRYMDPGFYTDKKQHLKIIAEAFQEIYDGKIKKLAVSIAPRAGKSYITSLFCAWVLGKEPDTSIMRNCYAAKLAEKFSKDIRDGVLLNLKYREVFPSVALNPKNTAIDGWSIGTNSQPSYFCAGVGGAITGFGCKRIAILDDPIKNIEEALSEVVINNIWNWYTSTHLSRLESGCAEIHIATRWSKYDPIGRLTDPDSESYDPNMKVICIPALDENGESFCDEIKTTEEYHQIRKVTDSFIWESEFMQQPIEEKGLLYPPRELNKFSIEEITGREPDAILAFIDTADKGTDFLSCVIGYRYRDHTYIVDVVFSQEGVEVTEPLVAQKIIDHRVDIMWIESNNGGYQYARNIRRLIAGKSFTNVIALPTTKNKETRILMNAGYIKDYYYFRNDFKAGSEYDKFYRQFTGYVRLAKNPHDDAPDSVTGLAENTKYKTYKKPAKKYIDDEDYMDPDEEFEELRRYMTGDKVNKEMFTW